MEVADDENGDGRHQDHTEKRPGAGAGLRDARDSDPSRVETNDKQILNENSQLYLLKPGSQIEFAAEENRTPHQIHTSDLPSFRFMDANYPDPQGHNIFKEIITGNPPPPEEYFDMQYLPGTTP